MDTPQVWVYLLATAAPGPAAGSLAMWVWAVGRADAAWRWARWMLCCRYRC